MSRPFKSGVDYFPLDVNIDDKIELLEAEHGIVGFGVWVKLLQKVYANNYWINWDNKSVIVFSSRINVNINSVNAIINSSLEWGIFDRNMLEKYKILTSRGIQKRFFEIIKRRNRVEVITEYLLVEPPASENIVLVNVYINSVNDDRSTQRKGKERKPKERKPKNEQTSKLFDAESLEMKISKYLYAVLLKSDPDLKEPNLQNWCKDIDNLIRVKKKTPEDIRTVINYAHDPSNSTDSFSWIPNIRSPKKLIKHFTTILLQSKKINFKKKEKTLTEIAAEMDGSDKFDFELTDFQEVRP